MIQKMSSFKLNAPYKPTGDQPQAIEKLVRGIKNKTAFQTLLGVTGSGKTFSMANVIAELNRPALVISHNKTLAAQLYQEFKEFFSENAVHYFVSYYDYYQPEAYMPVTDTYIEKDAKINDFIDQLRHAATASALTRRDFIIVASVSCIYGLGDPEEYEKQSLQLRSGQAIKRQEFLKHLALLQYERNDIQKTHGTFSVKGEAIEIVSPDGETTAKVEFFGDSIEKISDKKSGLLNMNGQALKAKKIFPAKHFVTPQEKLDLAIINIKKELAGQSKWFKKQGKLLEAQRLEQKTNFDMEMLEKTGYVNGIENYSRQLSFRRAGEPPSTLLDYLPDDTLFFIDESHMTMPQFRGMYAGDQSRKQTLVDYGFRLPSALDNRPLKFEEFEKKMGQTIFVSATPGLYELGKSTTEKRGGQLIDDRQLNAHGGAGVVEQLIRPTGLLDPKIEIRPAQSQIKNAEEEILKAIRVKERVLVLTLTKRLAEEITDYLLDRNIKAEYLHSEIKTIERSKTLQKLREGNFDVLVGINLLREGLDLPEVGLILVLDADKEGFLRNTVSLIQTVGRAARHPNGRAILYADTVTKSIQTTVDETNRRRKIQEEYNKQHGITPQAVVKEIRKPFWLEEKTLRPGSGQAAQLLKELYEELRDPQKIKLELERQMLEAANELNFEKAAELRDIVKTL